MYGSTRLELPVWSRFEKEKVRTNNCVPAIGTHRLFASRSNRPGGLGRAVETLHQFDSVLSGSTAAERNVSGVRPKNLGRSLQDEARNGGITELGRELGQRKLVATETTTMCLFLSWTLSGYTYKVAMTSGRCAATVGGHQ